MVFRFIFRYLANNERLVQRLSESYPIRRSAQLLVALFLRSKHAIKESGVTDNLSNNRLRSFAQRVKDNFKEELENAKRELKHKQK